MLNMDDLPPSYEMEMKAASNSTTNGDSQRQTGVIYSFDDT